MNIAAYDEVNAYAILLRNKALDDTLTDAGVSVSASQNTFRISNSGVFGGVVGGVFSVTTPVTRSAVSKET